MTESNPQELHFLVVDDDLESRSTIVEYLKSMGFNRMTLARDGAEAGLILDKDPTINFVISDWDMPMMNGLSLLQRMRSTPHTNQIPFLIVTSPVSEEAEKVILAAESYVDAYLIKPFRSQLLKQKIEELLKRSVHGVQKQALVVDDDPDARQMLTEYLHRLGFRNVHATQNGQEALAYLMLNAEKVGFIVSDWEMPEMSGLELLRTCKAKAEFKSIPFLMVTSQSSIERMKVVQAAQAQVDEYLLKPFSLEDIRLRVNQALEKTKYRKEIQTLLAEAQYHADYGQYKKAQNCLEQALKLDPKQDLALRAMGDLFQKNQELDLAIPYFRKAIEANPLNPKGYVKLANVYELQGKLDLSIGLLKQALEQISFNPELHFLLGRVYQKKGQVDLARIEFEKTLELQLDHQEARLLLEMLNQGPPR